MRTILIVSIFLIDVLFGSTDINECKTDIWFGNGVWNKKKDAIKSMHYLQEYIIKPTLVDGDLVLEKKYLPLQLAYNKHVSWDLDLIETFYQMKEAGQLSDRTFYVMLDELLSKRVADISGIDLQEMREQIIEYTSRTELENRQSLWDAYYEISFKRSHRVLLISHSQGNLFANRVFEDHIASSGYASYLANLQIASPATSIAAPMGAYVTNCIDPVINALPGSMRCNVNGFGHSMIGSYLDGGIDSSEAKDKIIRELRLLVKRLDESPSQWQVIQEPTDRRSCQDIRVTMGHRYDTSLPDITGVYPFRDSDYRLYPVEERHVMASCGGREMVDSEEDDDVCHTLETAYGVEQIDKEPSRFVSGHNISDFLPVDLIAPVGTIDDSTGCATAHIPEGYITFYRLRGSQTSCVPDYTFAYQSAQIYTCLPAAYFEMIGSIHVEEFLKVADYKGNVAICSGGNSSWTRK